jgi:cysteinyl-tRNA synthetase
MEQQVLPNESIIRKIQNLLEMAKRAAGNEQEAATAMNIAQQLLAKYNLDLQTVQGTQVVGGAVKVEEKRDKNKTNYRAAYRWQRLLWQVLAETNFCATWIEDRP